MTLGGLWHGAGWNFVLWGFLHGLVLVAERVRGARVFDHTEDRVPTAGEWPLIVRTFAIHTFALIIFRAGTLGRAAAVFTTLLTGSWALDFRAVADLLIVTVAAVTLLGVDLMQRSRPELVRAPTQRPAATGALAGVAVTAVVLFSGYTPEPFFYFQF
jgi:D-alanyl-lipoteichoic acid acyltransferase DltB (MBOAT superfamily)